VLAVLCCGAVTLERSNLVPDNVLQQMHALRCLSWRYGEPFL
jgi:hypothetical protein